MLVISLRLLTGRYVATVYNDRGRAEWPPHPARLFSALVAAHYEVCETRQGPDPLQREALEWLQRQEPPRIVAAAADFREVTPVFVPVNDTSVLQSWSSHEAKIDAARAELERLKQENPPKPKALAKAQRALEKAEAKLEDRLAAVVKADGKTAKRTMESALALLPENRVKQPRTFPSCRPTQPEVLFVWDHAEATNEHQEALDALLADVHRVGHSSSLVACCVGDPALIELRPREEFYVPDAKGNLRIRIPGPNQLQQLDTEFERSRGNSPGRTMPAIHARYRLGARPIEVEAPRSIFGSDWIVLRATHEPGRRRPVGLSLARTEDLTRALRGALMRHAHQPARPVLSGHGTDGKPIEEPHVAYVPLADVGSSWASGAVLGAAIVLPRELPASERSHVLQALGNWKAESLREERPMRLLMGRAGSLALEAVRLGDGESRKTLDSHTWTRGSQVWASVTAIALDRNPGDLKSRDPAKVEAAVVQAEATVARACMAIGLPEPEWVQVQRRSLFDAAPQAFDFMPYPKHSKAPRRVCVHAEIRFSEVVEGPVILGAGRYFGLGLCAPRDPHLSARRRSQ